MLRTAGLAVLVAGLASAAGPDDAVTVKVKKLAPGVVLQRTKTEDVTTRITVLTNGKAQVKEDRVTTRYAFTDEILTVNADGRPTKLRRVYKTAEETVAKKARPVGLVGKAIVVEKGADGYTFTADGKPLTGKAAEVLAKEFNAAMDAHDPDSLRPPKPVRVGDTWALDAKKVTEGFGVSGLTPDPEKSSASGKLLRVYDRDGRRYGVTEVTIEVAVTKLTEGTKVAPLQPGAAVAMTVTEDGCLDGTGYGRSMTTKFSTDLKPVVPNLDAAVVITGTTTATTAEVAKK